MGQISEIPIYDEAAIPGNVRGPYIVTYWNEELHDNWSFASAVLFLDRDNGVEEYELNVDDYDQARMRNQAHLIMTRLND